MDAKAYEAVMTKLDEIIGYAKANADADPSPHAAATWRAHERNVQYVRDLMAAQKLN